MVQARVFEKREVEELNKFISEGIELAGDVHINVDGSFVVFYHKKSVGMDTESLLMIMSKSLGTLQTDRVTKELEFRYWSGRQLVPSAKDKEQATEAAQNAAKLDQVKDQIETIDIKVRSVKKLIEEVEKGEFTI